MVQWCFYTSVMPTFASIHTLSSLNQGQGSIFKLWECAQSILRIKLLAYGLSVGKKFRFQNSCIGLIEKKFSENFFSIPLSGITILSILLGQKNPWPCCRWSLPIVDFHRDLGLGLGLLVRTRTVVEVFFTHVYCSLYAVLINQSSKLFMLQLFHRLVSVFF
jgi:hypothetical protein